MIESELLNTIAVNVAVIGERVATLKERSDSHEDRMDQLVESLHKIELSLASKKRPLVIGLSGGAVAAGLVHLLGKFLSL